MTKKSARNELCPCGSGRKYKKCCEAVDDPVNFKYRRFRKVEEDLLPLLLRYAMDTREPEIVSEAWNQFIDSPEPVQFNPENVINTIFLPWFLYKWVHEEKTPESEEFASTTIALSFVRDVEVTKEQMEVIVRNAVSIYSVYEVKATSPGQGMTLFDLLSHSTTEVVERSASQELKRGDIIYCAITEIEGVESISNLGPYPLPPTFKLDVINFRKYMLEEGASETIDADDLVEFQADLRGFYLYSVERILAPPVLVNTDGDPLKPQQLFFSIESPDSAFHALKSLAKGEPDNELQMTRNTGSKTAEVEIPWFAETSEARKGLAGPVLLGMIRISGNELVADVNSNERAAKVRKIIEELLGSEVKYGKTILGEIKWPLESMDASADHSKPGFDIESNEELFMSPESLPEEVRNALSESARQHWIDWMDSPVPMLNGMTPREAAQTEEGRDLLDSLLIFYERQSDSPVFNLMNPDVASLRLELGMVQPG